MIMIIQTFIYFKNIKKMILNMQQLIILLMIMLNIIVVQTISAKQKQQQLFCNKNSCDPKILEDNSNKLFMLGDPSFVFPNNTEQMNKRCK